MISLAEARSLIASRLNPLPPVAVSLQSALGRVLAEEVTADADAPAFDRSAMDGYAIKADDQSERFRVIGEIQPGAPAKLQVGAGECVRIFTGAAIPEGASQVVMQEDVTREGAWMIPTRRSEARHIRRRGEEMRKGDLILSRGIRLQAGELSMLAHLGRVAPVVSAQPRAVHIATGRELVDPGSAPGVGEIRDTNSTLIAALLEGSGAELVSQMRCGDELESLVERANSVPADSWDLLLISGGASVGDYDFGAQALGKLGFEIVFSKINLRPGKPLIFAVRGRQAAFVIPGNPVSHFILYYTAIQRALETLTRAVASWRTSWVPLTDALNISNEPRELFWPAKLEFGVALRVRPLKWRSSGDLGGLLGADALMRIPPLAGPFEASALVEVVLL